MKKTKLIAPPMCEGELINIYEYKETPESESITCVHVLASIQDYPDAPADSSGLREIDPLFMIVSLKTLAERAAKDRGIYELMSEFKQNLNVNPLTQDEFDKLLRDVEGFTNLSHLLNGKLKPGLWFIYAAPSCFSYQDVYNLTAEWEEHKKKAGLRHPTAALAEDWIENFWAKAHPEMDLPWLRDEAFTQISCIEEPCVPPVESGQQGKSLLGRRLRIDEMLGEPKFTGKIGTVTSVDDIGQLHGTWGGCALVPGTDAFTFLDDGLHGALRAPSTSGVDPSGRAPYETYRETEVFSIAANLSLAQMLRVYHSSNYTDLVMMEWLSAINDAELWNLDELAKDPERLFELIMSLEVMYKDYCKGGCGAQHDRCDFAYAVSETILDDDNLLFEDVYNHPSPVYDLLEEMN